MNASAADATIRVANSIKTITQLRNELWRLLIATANNVPPLNLGMASLMCLAVDRYLDYRSAAQGRPRTISETDEDMQTLSTNIRLAHEAAHAWAFRDQPARILSKRNDELGWHLNQITFDVVRVLNLDDIEYVDAFDQTLGTAPWNDPDFTKRLTFVRDRTDVLMIHVFDTRQCYSGPEEGGRWHYEGTPLATIPLRRIQYKETVTYHPNANVMPHEDDFDEENVLSVEADWNGRLNEGDYLELKDAQFHLPEVFGMASEEQHRSLPTLHPSFLQAKFGFGLAEAYSTYEPYE